MAWYALYKWFRPFRKRPYVDWARWYSEKLHQEWLDSLSNRERARQLRMEKRREEQNHRNATAAIAQIFAMNAVLRETAAKHSARVPWI